MPLIFAPLFLAAVTITTASAEVRVTGVLFDPHVSRSGHGDNWHMTWA